MDWVEDSYFPCPYCEGEVVIHKSEEILGEAFPFESCQQDKCEKHDVSGTVPTEKIISAIDIVKEKGLSTNELWFIKNDKSFEEYTETLKELYWGDEDLDKRLKTEEEYTLLKEIFS